MKYFLSFILCLFIYGSDSIARDYLVIQTNNCKFHQGLLIDAQDSVKLLSSSGKILEIDEEQISTILTYGINKSPFASKTKFNKNLSQFFKKISFRENDQVILGFPFQYIEDLVFIHSQKGKIIVVSRSEIKDIEPVLNMSWRIKSNTGIQVDYSEKAQECGIKLKDKKLGKTPIRVLGDNLKISEYLNNYKVGQRSFQDLEERTDFYFKPYLYPRRNRMGVVEISSQKESLPFFYQWSTGEDFHFQSINQFGGTISRYLPSFEKNTVFTSEFKSHFFHGYFEGNLTGLAAGEIPGDFSISPPSESIVVNNFNYMAFMGGDWKNFSFSYGGGYFSPYFNLKNYEGREVAANSISTAIRVAYAYSKYKFSVMGYFLDDKSSSSFEIEDQIEVESKNSVTEDNITKYEFQSTYYRASAVWDILSDLSLQGDFLIGSGSYTDEGVTGLELDYKSSAYLIQVNRKFGHYVTLTLLMKSEKHELDSKLGSTTKSFESDNTYYGGRFELLF